MRFEIVTFSLDFGDNCESLNLGSSSDQIKEFVFLSPSGTDLALISCGS